MAAQRAFAATLLELPPHALAVDGAEPHPPELQMHCAHACITLPLKTQSGWFIYQATPATAASTS